MVDFDLPRLGSNYKRYKLGTNKLVEWLCATANYVAHRSGEALDTVKPLSTAGLLRLAKAIGSSDPKVTVPIAILLCVKDVIDGRALCANFYKQLENAGTKTGEDFLRMNKSHRHFVSVLEEIQAHLLSLEVNSAGKPSVRPTKSNGKKPTFDILELEEPSDVSYATPSVPQDRPDHGQCDPTAASTPPDSAPGGLLEEDYAMEVSFAIFCAFQDMRVIRLHLQAVWKGYYKGDISYLVAIEITKAGFLITRDINDGLWTTYPAIDTYDDISEFLGLESCIAGHETTFFMNNLAKVLPDKGLRGPQGDVVNPEELFCAPAYAVLHDFRLYSRAEREPTNDNFRVSVSSHPLANILREVRQISKQET